MLETLDYTIRIGSAPTFLHFDLYLYSAYAAHFVDFLNYDILFSLKKRTEEIEREKTQYNMFLDAACKVVIDHKTKIQVKHINNYQLKVYATERFLCLKLRT